MDDSPPRVSRREQNRSPLRGSPAGRPRGAGGWLDHGGPRRWIERLPVGVPLGAVVTAGALAAGDAAGLVSDALAWGLGGVCVLGAQAYGFYAAAAWWHARRARSEADAVDDADAPLRLFDPTEVPPASPGAAPPRRAAAPVRVLGVPAPARDRADDAPPP